MHRVEMAIKIGMRTLPVYIVDWIDTNNIMMNMQEVHT